MTNRNNFSHLLSKPPHLFNNLCKVKCYWCQNGILNSTNLGTFFLEYIQNKIYETEHYTAVFQFLTVIESKCTGKQIVSELIMELGDSNKDGRKYKPIWRITWRINTTVI